MNELELTIASIKIQPFKDIYQMNVAFDKGTIFKQLDKPSVMYREWNTYANPQTWFLYSRSYTLFRYTS